MLEKLDQIGVCLLTHRCKLKGYWLTRFDFEGCCLITNMGCYERFFTSKLVLVIFPEISIVALKSSHSQVISALVPR